MSADVRSVEIFDTTLRDGSQLEGLSLTVDDKLRIAEQLDHLGVHYIEGGWPGANPKDDEFFRRLPDELSLKTATMVAFGSTRRPLGKVDSDDTLRNLVGAGTSAVCIVGKAWDYHVTQALQTTLDEGIAMVADSVSFLSRSGLRVLFDAEHFFDGYRRNPEYSLRVLEAAATNGVQTLVLCDTNGGTLPDDVERIVAEVVAYFGDVPIGVHFHDDSGCAVANALAAVRQGARQVQGCINGYGERTGNANLTTIIPNLSLKMGVATIPADRIERLTPVAHHIAELVNVTPSPQQPYVGSSAFAHKAGLHTSAIARARDAYEHISPDAVGNGTRFVVSELAGRSTLAMKAAEIGLELDGRALGDVLTQLKDLEHRGYHFEAADGSLELLMRKAAGWKQTYFQLESFRVITDKRDGAFTTEATIKVHVGDERVLATAEGNGPVNALDGALRKAIGAYYPGLSHLHLTDYKVRVLDTTKGTGAVTRVLIDSTDGESSWSTIGVSENIIEASWEALSDSIVYGLLQQSRLAEGGAA
jgi:2-isopropylmalate synthase